VQRSKAATISRTAASLPKATSLRGFRSGSGTAFALRWPSSNIVRVPEPKAREEIS